MTTLTRHCSSKRRSSKESASAGSFTVAGGTQWQRGYGSPSPGRQTPEQVPSPLPAPQQHLPSNIEKGESAAGEGASREGASSQDEGRVTDLDSESGVDTTRVGPVLPVTRKAPAAEAGAGAGRVAEGNPPAPSAPSRRVETNRSSHSSNFKDDSNSRRGSGSNASNSTGSSVSNGDMPALTGTEVRRLQFFGKPPELQSGRMRSQSRGWASIADARGRNHVDGF